MDGDLPIDLQALFKLALRPQFEIEKAAQDAPARPQIPIVKELIESILFSRRFITSYLVVLVTLILLYAAASRLVLISRRRKASYGIQRSQEIPSSVASSSSSTLRGTESPPHKNSSDDERSRLLVYCEGEDEEPRSWFTRTWHYVRSWLLYRPKPIPALTAHNNNLPANKVSITIMGFLALNVFYVFYNLPLRRAMVFAVADRAGLLFVVNLPVLYVLAAKNNQPLQVVTKWSYEGLNIFHRRLGEWMTISAVIHASGMVIAFYDLIAPAGFTIWWYLTRKIIIFGCIAFVSYILLYLTSTGFVRQTLYEFFLASHILLQIMALIMLFLHHHDARPYVGAALGIWLLDRLVARVWCKSGSFIATLEVAADGQTVLLHTQVRMEATRSGGLQNGWHAGQHVFLTIPSMGTRYRFQSHPFTIASPAPVAPHSFEQWPLQLIIRAQGGFSKDLLEFAKLHQHVEILLDGPYSSSEVFQDFIESERVCLVAGGSGIAVTYPFAWAKQVSAHKLLWTRPFYQDGELVKPNITMASLSTERYKFAHFWVRQEATHDNWICSVPQGSCPVEFLPDSTKQGMITPMNAIDLVTHRFSTRSNTGQHHRPDIRAELEAWVREDKHQQHLKHRRICVVVSGPDGLIRDVQNAVAALSKQGFTNLVVHVEAFGW